MLSTVFFIDDQPVGYTVTEEQERYSFAPSAHSNSHSAPSFFAVQRENNWVIEGLDDTRLHEQVQVFLPALAKGNSVLSAAL
jgi:hypothetical protein